MRRIHFPALVQPELGRRRYRRIVLGVVLVALVWYAASRIMEDTQSILSEGAEGIADQLIGALVYLYVLWKVYSQPRRWGFGIGLLLAAMVLFGFLIAGVLTVASPEIAKTNTGLALSIQESRSALEWFLAVLRVAMILAITAAFLSLRWLYPKVPPPQTLPASPLIGS